MAAAFGSSSPVDEHVAKYRDRAGTSPALVWLWAHRRNESPNLRILTPPARLLRFATMDAPSSDCSRISGLCRGSPQAPGHEGSRARGANRLRAALPRPGELSACPRAGQSRCAVMSSSSKQPLVSSGSPLASFAQAVGAAVKSVPYFHTAQG